MKKHFLFFLLFLISFSIGGLGACHKAVPPPSTPSAYPSPPPPQVSSPPPPVEWRYAKDAIRLHLQGDPKLNLFQGDAHTLMVCVYNLGDPNAFNHLVGEKEGLTKLLECGRFDPSVASSKRLVVQPGQELTESLDRAEGAKYVGFVAGYFSFQKEKMVRLFSIPLLEETQGVLFRTKSSIPAVLNIDLYLGPQEIQEPKGK